MSFKLPTYALSAVMLATSVVSLSACAVAVPAPAPAHHPYYLHALTDLRDARWNLAHRPGDVAVSTQEDVAILETDRAIGEAKRAAAEDGKNEADHPHEDAKLDRPGRLHHALELLRKAHTDVSQEEDNPETRAIRGHIDEHIDLAIQATERALQDAGQRH